MDVSKIAQMAKLELTANQKKKLSLELSETVTFVEIINQIDTSSVSSVNQIIGLTNISRPDDIEPDRILKQEQVVSAAPASYRGYIVTEPII